MSTQVSNPEVLNIRKNINGTISIELKGKGMRKAQDFITYPIKKGDETFLIQSDTRIARVSNEGKILMSRPHSNGAYFHHLNLDKLTPMQFNKSDWQQIKDYIGLTAGDSVGNEVIKSDNSGAKSIFDL